MTRNPSQNCFHHVYNLLPPVFVAIIPSGYRVWCGCPPLSFTAKLVTSLSRWQAWLTIAFQAVFSQKTFPIAHDCDSAARRIRNELKEWNHRGRFRIENERFRFQVREFETKWITTTVRTVIANNEVFWRVGKTLESNSHESGHWTLLAANESYSDFFIVLHWTHLRF